VAECFWVDADEQLVALFEAQMGVDGAYDTLVVQRVMSVALRDVAEWVALATKGDLPLIAIQGNQIVYASGAHGDSQMHADKRYNYLIIGVVSGGIVQATADAKTLSRRIEKTLLAKQALTSSNDEGALPLSIKQAELIPFPRTSTDADSWFVCSLTAVWIETTV